MRRTHAVGAATVLAAMMLAPGPRAHAQSSLPAVFVVNNVSDEMTSFVRNPDGTLEFIDTFATSDGPQTAALSPNGRWLAVGHGTIASVTEVLQIFRVNPDASLSLAHTTVVPDSPLDCAWLADDVFAVLDTSGPGNGVLTYGWDPIGPLLLPIDSATTGSFSSSLVVHPALDVLYVQDSSNNDIHRIGFDAGGTLTPLDVTSTGSLFPLRLAMSGDGMNLYAGCGISGGGDKVLGYRVDPAGALAAIAGSPFVSPGASPAHLAVSDDDAYLFVGHGTDATIHSFTIAADGALAPTGFSFDVGTQGTIGDIRAFGDVLLVTDESTVSDGISGLYTLAINPDGSLTPTNAIYPTNGVRPERIVTWSGPGIVGDLDGNGSVGFADLNILLAAWGPCPAPPDDCPADLDGNGSVGFNDLNLLLANWGA